jgi:hypothetical protein
VLARLSATTPTALGILPFLCFDTRLDLFVKPRVHETNSWRRWVNRCHPTFQKITFFSFLLKTNPFLGLLFKPLAPLPLCVTLWSVTLYLF